MKKEYTKPVIMFESFSLCTNIAAGCALMANFSQNDCGYVVASGRGERVIFAEPITGCTTDVPYDVVHQDFVYQNEICYHVPYSYATLFNS